MNESDHYSLKEVWLGNPLLCSIKLEGKWGFTEILDSSDNH